MCSLSSRATQLFAGGTLAEWLAFWWPLWQPTVGMRSCFRTERHALLLCHASGRLQACHPWGTRLQNLFTPLKGSLMPGKECLKGPCSTQWIRGINETLISFPIEPCWSIPCRSKMYATLCNSEKNASYLFIVWLLGPYKIKLSSTLWLALHADTCHDTFRSHAKNQQRYPSCWRSERKRGWWRTWGMGRKWIKRTSFPVKPFSLSAVWLICLRGEANVFCLKSP